MGIDFARLTKRSHGLIATPNRPRRKDKGRQVTRVIELTESIDVQKIVGIPFHLDGEEGVMATTAESMRRMNSRGLGGPRR